MSSSIDSLATPDIAKCTANVGPTPQSVIDEFRNLTSNSDTSRGGSVGISPRNEDETEERFRSLLGSIEMHPEALVKDAEKAAIERRKSSSSRKSKKKKKHKHKSKSNKSSSAAVRAQRVARRERRKEKFNNPQTSGSTDRSWGIKSVVSDNMDSWTPFEASDAEFSASNHDESHCTEPTSNVDQHMLSASLLEPAADDSPGGGKQALMPTFDNMMVVQGTSQRNSPSRKSRTSTDRSQTSSLHATPSVIGRAVQQVAQNLQVEVPRSVSPRASPSSSKDWSRESDKVESLEFSDDDSQKLRKKAARSALRRAKVNRRKRSFAGSKKSFSGMMLNGEQEDDIETMSTLSYDPVLDFLAAANATAREGGDARSGDKLSDSVDLEILSEAEKQKLLAEAVKMARASKLMLKAKIKSSKSLADVLEVSQEGENTEDESPATTQTKDGSSQNLSVLSSSNNNSSATPGGFLSTQELTLALSSVDGSKEPSIFVDEEMGERMPQAVNVEASIQEKSTTEESTMTPKKKTRMDRESCCKFMRKTRVLVGISATSILVIIMIIIIAVTVPSSSGGESDRGINPAPSPTFESSEAEEMLESVVMSDAHLDETTPQGRAYQWIVRSDQGFSLSSRASIIQRYALGTLYYALDGEKWLDSDGWMSSDDECTWFSSHAEPCDDRGNFVHLKLRSNHLHGELPPELALLTSVESIELPGNLLFGTIPATLEDAGALAVLNLNSNNYKGEIPAHVARFSNLKVLSLDLNRFTGQLPTSFRLMTQLEILSLAANRLSMAIPADISEMGELHELNLEQNEISGRIRSELGLLRNLRSLRLDLNLLGGTIPTEIGLLTNLKVFSCSNNDIFRELPTEFGSLRRLEVFDVESNQLTGTLPSEIGNAVSLKIMDFASNRFSGSLPETLGNLLSIQVLDLSMNQLSGKVPSELRSFSKQGFTVLLHDNILTGAVPGEVCIALEEHDGYMSLDDLAVKPCVCPGCTGPPKI